jgi:hypothetical protein
MRLSAELHALATLPTKNELPVPVKVDAVWPPYTLWTLWQQNKPPAPCQELNRR